MSVFNNFKSKNLKPVIGSSSNTKGVLNSKILKTTKIKESLVSKFPKQVIDALASTKPDSTSSPKISDSRIVSLPGLSNNLASAAVADAIRSPIPPVSVRPVVPSTPSPIPSVPEPAPSLPPDAQPILESGVSIEPTFSSSQQSVLFLPSLATSERFVGNILESLEKPRIVGILENEINSSGIPKESVLFIKRIDTSKYFEERYVVLRRAMFYQNEYYEIGSLVGDQITLDKKFATVASLNFPSYKDLITFVDNNINAHQSYSYKIRIEYRELTDQEKRSKSLLSSRIRQGLNTPGLLGSQLFNPNGEE